MLYALRHPLALLALVAGFLLAVVVRGLAQSVATRLLGSGPALRSARYGASPASGGRRRASLRRLADPQRHLDAFGTLAAVLAGVGWGRPAPEPGRSRAGRGRTAAALLAGPLACVLLGAGLLLGYLGAGGPRFGLLDARLRFALHGSFDPLPTGQLLLLAAGVEALAVGLLALVPLPPLDGGRVLFLLGPRTPGWQKAEYALSDQNWGILALLVLLLLPLGGTAPLLVNLLDLVAHPMLRGIGQLAG